jgi:hypothetical protein
MENVTVVMPGCRHEQRVACHDADAHCSKPEHCTGTVKVGHRQADRGALTHKEHRLPCCVLVD